MIAFCLNIKYQLQKLFPLWQRTHARINRVLAEQLFDAQKLVVFRRAIRAAQRTGLDLAAIRRDGDVRDG